MSRKALWYSTRKVTNYWVGEEKYTTHNIAIDKFIFKYKFGSHCVFLNKQFKCRRHESFENNKNLNSRGNLY